MRTERITKQEIEAELTLAGGYTKATLDKWGVPWPPPKGWKQRLIDGGVPFDRGDVS
jgi:hypothetical protein